MPGLVKMIACKEGDSVEAGTTVVILEAMKMQNPLFAPISGVVSVLHCLRMCNMGHCIIPDVGMICYINVIFSVTYQDPLKLL